MTLHETVETMKKLSIGSAIGISLIIVLVITVRVGIFIKNVMYPPVAAPANATYGKLPLLIFPENATDAPLTFTLNTVSGGFDKFPDRLNVYKINNPAPSFDNLPKARDKARVLDFLNNAGELVEEIAVGDETFEWEETKGLQRKLTFNIVNFDFNLTSNYLTSLTVLNAEGLPDLGEVGAIKTATETLEDMELRPTDLDLTKTENTEKKVNYYTYPQTLSIRNGVLSPATSLSNAQVIRVDLYQKDVEYELNTGFENDLGGAKREKVKIPIIYPKPPFSTMSFWIGIGPIGPSVVEAKYAHKNYIVEKNEDPTYPLKTADQAFEELQNGIGYIASYNGSPEGSEVLITNAFLAYYTGEEHQDYLMPVYVFEGDNGFFAYVSAVENDLTE